MSRPGRLPKHLRPLALLAVAGCGLLEAQAPNPPTGTLNGELFIRHRPETCKHGFPFLDLADGLRFDGRGRVADETAPLELPPTRTGYGLPCTLHWPRPADALAQLLSYRQGDQVLRRDVTCRYSRVAVFRAPVRDCTVEALCPVPGTEDQWCSHLWRLPVDVRGVFPFAGDPLAPAEHRDGPGAAARFREAFDATRIPVGSAWSRQVRWDLLVTDPAAHVLRRVTPDGAVTTFCGDPDQPGHQDSPGLLQRLGSVWSRQPAPPPRFNRPTYLASRKCPGVSDWEVLVADSGNHVIRRLGLDGQVDTLAGGPAQAGHHDADDPHEALFNDPRGIAVDAEGTTFVADRGNHVIRRIAPNGQVTTLAGSPGQPGTADGIGNSARFTALAGLAWKATGAQGGILFALDGHAVRAISLPDGVVATVLGQVDTPGFRDAPADPGSPALRRPCLRDPAGIRCRGGAIHLADTGNHAIRRLDLDQAALVTVAGDPQAAATRWGLLRDGIPGPLGLDYAALAAPTALVGPPPGPEGPVLVCAGRGLGEIRDGREVRDTVALADVECRPENRIGSRTMMVVFRALTADRHQRSQVREIHYSVDFLDPGGALACRREGHGLSALLVAVQGGFTRAGQGTVVIRCATEEGVSAGAQVAVPVGDPGPGPDTAP